MYQPQLARKNMGVFQHHCPESLPSFGFRLITCCSSINCLEASVLLAVMHSLSAAWCCRPAACFCRLFFDTDLCSLSWINSHWMVVAVVVICTGCHLFPKLGDTKSSVDTFFVVLPIAWPDVTLVISWWLSWVFSTLCWSGLKICRPLYLFKS